MSELNMLGRNIKRRFMNRGQVTRRVDQSAPVHAPRANRLPNSTRHLPLVMLYLHVLF